MSTQHLEIAALVYFIVSVSVQWWTLWELKVKFREAKNLAAELKRARNDAKELRAQIDQLKTRSSNSDDIIQRQIRQIDQAEDKLIRCIKQGQVKDHQIEELKQRIVELNQF